MIVVIAKNLADIAAAEIQELIDNDVCESTTLEFKRDLPGGGDEAKREFLADVSALANTSGGDLLFGIEEENGCASAITGIRVEDLDAEILRLGNILNNGLEPRIRYSHLAIPCPEGTVLLLRIDRSWNAPHRVVFKAYDKFFARAATGKYPLDVQQLRRAFIENSTVTERMRNFRADRLASIIAGVTPVHMRGTSKLVIHMLPFEAFFSEPQFDLREQLSHDSFRPLVGDSWSDRLTFEGRIVVASPRDGLSPSYLHFYRNGVIEMVDAAILSRTMPDNPNLHYIPSVGVERLIVTGVARGLRLMRHVGATAPVALAVTLTNVKDMILGFDDYQSYEQHPVLNTHLFFPEAIFAELANPTGPVLRPLFDLLWNACGINRSPHFDADSNWTPR
jgi:hypothetical protein